ncbi:MAG TPA: calcium-binding protein [Leptolyngbyaceae cyanobacterium]
MAIGPSSDGFYYLLDDADNNLTLPPSFLTPHPGGLIALGGNDSIVGSEDAEIIFTNMGQDTISGGGGNDTLFGGKDRDVLKGDNGDDYLNGNIGQDLIFGGNGNDFIRGGKDEDLLIGGEGNDTLIGDMGGDALVGNAGRDLFVIRTDAASLEQLRPDLIVDFDKSSDRIALTGNLTEADFILETFTQSIQELLTKYGIDRNPEQARLEVFFIAGVDIDPNGDGIATGTQIRIANTGQIFGYALNVSPGDVSGNFVNIPPV